MMMIYMIYQVLGVYLSFVYVNVIAIYMCMYAVGYIYVCAGWFAAWCYCLLLIVAGMLLFVVFCYKYTCHCACNIM